MAPLTGATCAAITWAGLMVPYLRVDQPAAADAQPGAEPEVKGEAEPEAAPETGV